MSKRKGHGGPVEVRIEHIAGLMRSLQWKTGETGPALAKEWGLSEKRMRELAAEASKRVSSEEILSPEYAQTFVLSALEKLIVDGLASDNPLARRYVVEACRLVTEITEKAAKAVAGVGTEPPRFVVELVAPERPRPPEH